jgi:hypothetical protein
VREDFERTPHAGWWCHNLCGDDGDCRANVAAIVDRMEPSGTNLLSLGFVWVGRFFRRMAGMGIDDPRWPTE